MPQTPASGYISLSDGLKISYTDNQKDSLVSIVFVHGNSSSSEAWESVFDHSNFSNYRVITFDWPGHGKSEQATNPNIAYKFDSFTDILIQLTNLLGLRKVVYAGHSIGGHILLQSLPKLSSAIGLFAAGSAPVESVEKIGEAYEISEAISVIFTENISIEVADAFVKDAISPANPKAAVKLKNQVLNTDPKFRSCFAEDLINLKNEWDIIEDASFPIALISSDLDILKNEYLEINCSDKNIWRKSVQYINNSGHGLPLEQPEQIAAMLQQYLNELNIKN